MKRNYRLIGKILSCVLAINGAAMLLPAAIALIYKEPEQLAVYGIFGFALLILGFAGIKLISKSAVFSLKISDGFVTVFLSWLLMSLLGALPFAISGDIPSYIDAFFETASGFSTTGSTCLSDVEILSKAGLFWRSFTHWLGGMGILVMTIALLPRLGIGGQRLMRAESTGLSLDKSGRTFSSQARSLYVIYGIFTAAEFILLMLCGLSPFDSIIHTFGSVGTGGFSNYNASVGALNNLPAELIMALFMLLCGTNFSNLALIFTGKIKKAFADAELRLYIAIVAVSTAAIALILSLSRYADFGTALRQSFFQVVSIISTSGFSTVNYDLWPESCKLIIFILMFTGACAGSTAGGIKLVRVALMGKLIRRGAVRKLHPESVIPVKLNKTYIKDDIVIDSFGFIALYMFTAGISTFLISLENVDMLTAFSSVISSLSNIGPGFNLAGPAQNFGFYSAPAKILLALLMIMGRLELYTAIVALKKEK